MAANFNLIAPVYDMLSSMVYGNNLIEAKKAFLDQIPEHGWVLLMGGGTGNILNQIFEKKPGIHIDFVDSSAGMIRLAKKHLKKEYHNRINFICGDHHAIPTQKSYDVVTSFFVIDCFQQKEALEFAKAITDGLKEEGRWLFADFFYTEQWLQRWLIAFMYRCFKIVSNISARRLPDYDALFESEHFKMISEKSFLSGLIRSRIYLRQSNHEEAGRATVDA